MEKKRDAETIEEREIRIERERNKRQKKINTEIVEEREEPKMQRKECEYHQCYKEKTPQNFSIENNMNPGKNYINSVKKKKEIRKLIYKLDLVDVPQELQNLTNIE
ncbi:1615_t:CDS:2 [Gigaspora margarita]|uniref:1615_t:CDS:1 n=1 Tax=Gigaspora margarita TaxID=4874 RepID=A0ABN7V4A7_GIGMA|nr:1615_t:CDS:2 [Gigaspora margarita]